MCTIYVRVTALRAAQNALAGRSLPTSGLEHTCILSAPKFLNSQ